eukprot:gene9966-20727_t
MNILIFTACLATSYGLIKQNLASSKVENVLKMVPQGDFEGLSKPVTNIENQRNMFTRKIGKSLAAMSIFHTAKSSSVHATETCLCENCRDTNICGMESDARIESTWYNPQNARIFDTARNSYLPPHPELYLPTALKGKQIICVGEVHSNPCHHKLEFDIIKSLSIMVPSSNLAIGLECFYRQHQKALDRYIFKHRNFSILKKETNWDITWGFDINYYAKIFHFAALNGIRLVGLNIPMAVTQLVGQQGLEALPPKLKALLPHVDLTNVQHKQLFYNAIRLSGHVPSNREALDRMYQAQTLWDEYMAESAANYIQSSAPDSILCIIAGATHIYGRNGIPNRIEKRTQKEAFVIAPQQVNWYKDSGLPGVVAPPTPADCDWAWFTQKEIVGYS